MSAFGVMFFGVWNIRGLNDPMKQRFVRKFILEHNLALMGLVETKVKEVNKGGVFRAIAKGWKVICNYSSSPRGRIWVCWDPLGVDVSLLSQNNQVIHCLVRECSGSWCCVVSFVYGENCYSMRESL